MTGKSAPKSCTTPRPVFADACRVFRLCRAVTDRICHAIGALNPGSRCDHGDTARRPRPKLLVEERVGPAHPRDFGDVAKPNGTGLADIDASPAANLNPTLAMRSRSCLTLALLALMLNACGSGGVTSTPERQGPQAPINEPDTGIFDPPLDSMDEDPGDSEILDGPEAGSDPISRPSRSPREKILRDLRGTPRRPGQAPHQSTQVKEDARRRKGSTQPGGLPSDGSSGSSVAPGGAQPVPEPGTLILFGTGIAGLGASMLRRRRRNLGGGPAA